MTRLLLIIVLNALVSNVLLVRFLGICSFLGVSQQIKASASLGAAVIFVMAIASAVANLLYDNVLVPLRIEFMHTIIFILVIAALVQIVEMFLKKKSPAVLGIANSNIGSGFVDSVLTGIGTAVGYTIAIVLLAGIRSRISESDLPRPLRGAPVVLLAAALMAIAFMGFSVLEPVIKSTLGGA